jgi:hypothetical protein
VEHNVSTRLHRVNTLVATVQSLEINELEKFSQDIHPERIPNPESRNDYYNRLL